MPERLTVVCLDDGAVLDLGADARREADDGAEYAIHGSSDALVSIFSGNSVFGQDLLDGKVYAVGSLQARVGPHRRLPRLDDAGHHMTPEELGAWLDEQRDHDRAHRGSRRSTVSCSANT